jgi:hypothetical protein
MLPCAPQVENAKRHEAWLKWRAMAELGVYNCDDDEEEKEESNTTARKPRPKRGHNFKGKAPGRTGPRGKPRARRRGR